MTDPAQRAFNAYAQVALETTVSGASPHGLITLLFDGVLKALRQASAHRVAGDLAGKGEALSRAIAIVSELRLSLAPEHGPEIAERLDALYDYAGWRLVAANLENDGKKIEEVEFILAELRSAWVAIEPKPATAAESAP